MSDLAVGDCGVCIGGYDGDAADIFASRLVVARKAHQCYECEKEIPPGAKYERIKILYEGEWSCYEICMICSEIGTVFSCDGRCLGILWEDIHDTLFPNMTTGCLAKLKTAAAKQHLLDKWNEWKFGRRP
jgi:hypothetical protein